ncbi:hypothetical protein LTR66_011591 [Elasticomyces elasticus]|nr:hypothetical protein LTR66_011591 [Elasticomyces elasticus]
MTVSLGPSRRFVAMLLLVAFAVSVSFVTIFRGHPQGSRLPSDAHSVAPARHVDVQASTLTGHVIAPKLGNETAKYGTPEYGRTAQQDRNEPLTAVCRAELGRAAWKLFHTVFARFPDKPTADESTALQSYIHLFQRLYPCGECAAHFRTIIDRYPPQVSSRSVAAAWGCHVHNEVNKSLDKPIFDCSNIGDFYDCGCAKDEEGGKTDQTGGEMSKERVEKLTGVNGREFDTDLFTADRPLTLEKEGWGRGG